MLRCVYFVIFATSTTIIITFTIIFIILRPQGLTVQAGTMKQGILPRNHLPVKAVIGVMGAAVRHISWSQSVMFEVLGVYEI